MTNIFIDGSAGTTGLRIRDRLYARKDLHLLTLPEPLRKDPSARREAMAQADVTFLCLPDAAAREAVALAEGTKTVLIDTSTAHRTSPEWTYGFPELPGLREKIASSRRIANPGCHASGFLALTAPLVNAGLLREDAKLSCFSLTGYSGGGKAMIAAYEAEERDPLLSAPRQYALGQAHKHLPEMQVFSGLQSPPAFCPIVADFYSGMEVTVPLFASDLRGTIADVKDAFAACYQSRILHYDGEAEQAEGGFLSAAAFAGRDDMQITVCGNEERLLLIARFDNLGKGASGAAIQNLNLLLGVDETTGLVV